MISSSLFKPKNLTKYFLLSCIIWTLSSCKGGASSSDPSEGGGGGGGASCANWGASWTDRNAAIAAGTVDIQGVRIASDSKIFAFGSTGLVSSSVTNGAAWTDLRPVLNTAGNTIFDIAVGPNGAFLAGANGSLWVSLDGAATWTNRSAVAGVGGAVFVLGAAMSSTGGMVASGTSGYLRVSADNGATWIDHNTAAGSLTKSLESVAVDSLGRIYVVGSAGFIKRYDGDWQNPQPTDWVNLNANIGTIRTWIRSIQISSNDTIVIAGDSGVAATSSDAGATWIDLSADLATAGVHLWGASVDSSNRAVVVGSNGFIKTNSDLGSASWIDRNAAIGSIATILMGTAIGPNGDLAVVGFNGAVYTSPCAAQ